MKKHLFLLSSVFAALSLQAQVATMKVASNTGVKVKTGTTLYVGGEMKVAQYTNSNKISNEGNIKITQKLTNENNTDGSNFVNEFVGVGKYGQLIINSGTMDANKGKIASEISFNGSANFLDLAIPYKSSGGEQYKAQDVVKQAFDAADVASAFVGYNAGRSSSPEYGTKYDGERYKNPLFYWNNKTFSSDNLLADDELNEPARAYALSGFSSLGNFYRAASGRDVRSLSGTPSKDVIEVEVSPYEIDNNSSTNKYGEAYGSYITDFSRSAPSNWASYGELDGGVPNEGGYGENIFYFGNPYTSNIDLSKGDGFLDNVETIYQSTSYNYNEDGTALSTTYQKNGVLTKDGTGDDAIYVRPFQTFAVKVDFGQKTSHRFVFKDEMKVFSIPEGRDALNNLYLRNRSEGNSLVNQVGIDLYDANGFTGAKTYVVASDIYEASQKGKGVEVYDVMIGDDYTGIYTLQEKEDGTIDEKLTSNKTYINGVNESKYIAKPIHLVFQNGKGQYTFKARLNKDLKENKNSFYFEDRVTGDVVKVTNDFSYTFNINGTEKDRFVLYWASMPNAKKEVVEEETVDTTVVFKDLNDFKVRFDKSMNKADVFVYNISGQLINADKNVSTASDYIVPVKGNSSVYIVKIIGDNGKVVTKKIIK